MADRAGTAIPSRLAALGGIAAGLIVSPEVAGSDPLFPAALGAILIAAAAAARRRAAEKKRARACSAATVGALGSLALLAAAGTMLGLGGGTWRLEAIDRGALDLEAGARITATGHLSAAPRRSSGKVRLHLATPDGRLMVEVPEPVADLGPGDAIRATGTIRDPLPWEEGYLRRQGIRDVLVARRAAPVGGRRAGIFGWLDGVRERIEDGLARGTGSAPASLLRGFVLGQDDRIDPRTVEDFRRSGLAHLLAVSGTNVMLLSLLAIAVLGVLGVPLRARLLWVLALIAIYVPVAGAGPSIQRAGVMGVAGVVAVLASRPRSRGYALLLAAVATLALNPRAAGEVGWQLSFAAVAGILLWTRRLSELLQSPRGERRSRLRRAVADGTALTVAATVATAPLMAHHFDAFSITSLPANLLALPAVAPVMWLGMSAGAAAQVPGLPVEPITALGGALAAYIGQISAWMATPQWALLEVEIGSPGTIVVAYVLLGGVLTLAIRWAERRRALRARPSTLAAALAVAAAFGSLLVPSAVGSLAGERSSSYEVRTNGLTISVLDVGQGDAILLDPGDGDPILVDTGPPGAGVAGQLRDRGIDRLGAIVITHPDSDHSGGAAEILASVPTTLLAQANADRALGAAARASGTRTSRIAAGDRLRSGSLRLEAIWPLPRLLELDWAREQPNRLSLVLIARFRGFRMLLTGDAEAEVTPLEPGPIDVLKVAHHGSADAGLDALLGRTRAQLAVVSAGEGNPFGHPHPSTLATLDEHGVTALRTDAHGEVRIDVVRGGWQAAPAR
jgi:competence protein ComEC